MEVGEAGDQLGALVRGVKREEVKRGMVLCPPGTVTAHTQFKGQVSEKFVLCNCRASFENLMYLLNVHTYC